jgi:hypothetical protein
METRFLKELEPVVKKLFHVDGNAPLSFNAKERMWTEVSQQEIFRVPLEDISEQEYLSNSDVTWEVTRSLNAGQLSVNGSPVKVVTNGKKLTFKDFSDKVIGNIPDDFKGGVFFLASSTGLKTGTGKNKVQKIPGLSMALQEAVCLNFGKRGDNLGFSFRINRGNNEAGKVSIQVIKEGGLIINSTSEITDYIPMPVGSSEIEVISPLPKAIKFSETIQLEINGECLVGTRLSAQMEVPPFFPWESGKELVLSYEQLSEDDFDLFLNLTKKHRRDMVILSYDNDKGFFDFRHYQYGQLIASGRISKKFVADTLGVSEDKLSGETKLTYEAAQAIRKRCEEIKKTTHFEKQEAEALRSFLKGMSEKRASQYEMTTSKNTGNSRNGDIFTVGSHISYKVNSNGEKPDIEKVLKAKVSGEKGFLGDVESACFDIKREAESFQYFDLKQKKKDFELPEAKEGDTIGDFDAGLGFWNFLKTLGGTDALNRHLFFAASQCTKRGGLIGAIQNPMLQGLSGLNLIATTEGNKFVLKIEKENQANILLSTCVSELILKNNPGFKIKLQSPLTVETSYTITEKGFYNSDAYHLYSRDSGFEFVHAIEKVAKFAEELKSDFEKIAMDGADFSIDGPDKISIQLYSDKKTAGKISLERQKKWFGREAWRVNIDEDNKVTKAKLLELPIFQRKDFILPDSDCNEQARRSRESVLRADELVKDRFLEGYSVNSDEYGYYTFKGMPKNFGGANLSNATYKKREKDGRIVGFEADVEAINEAFDITIEKAKSGSFGDILRLIKSGGVDYSLSKINSSNEKVLVTDYADQLKTSFGDELGKAIFFVMTSSGGKITKPGESKTTSVLPAFGGEGYYQLFKTIPFFNQTIFFPDSFEEFVIKSLKKNKVEMLVISRSNTVVTEVTETVVKKGKKEEHIKRYNYLLYKPIEVLTRLVLEKQEEKIVGSIGKMELKNMRFSLLENAMRFNPDNHSDHWLVEIFSQAQFGCLPKFLKSVQEFDLAQYEKALKKLSAEQLKILLDYSKKVSMNGAVQELKKSKLTEFINCVNRIQSEAEFAEDLVDYFNEQLGKRESPISQASVVDTCGQEEIGGDIGWLHWFKSPRLLDKQAIKEVCSFQLKGGKDNIEWKKTTDPAVTYEYECIIRGENHRFIDIALECAKKKSKIKYIDVTSIVRDLSDLSKKEEKRSKLEAKLGYLVNQSTSTTYAFDVIAYDVQRGSYVKFNDYESLKDWMQHKTSRSFEEEKEKSVGSSDPVLPPGESLTVGPLGS